MRKVSIPLGNSSHRRKNNHSMKKTKDRQADYKITVDIETLTAMLSCGRDTAKKIGEDAGARIVIGRRVLYSVRKVEEYVNDISL